MQTPRRSDGLISRADIDDRQPAQAASAPRAFTDQNRYAAHREAEPKPAGHRAMIGAMLKAGYGVEDIAVKTGLTVRETRFAVALLRESGSLRTVLHGKPMQKASAARID